MNSNKTEFWEKEINALYKDLRCHPEGLTHEQAAARLRKRHKKEKIRYPGWNTFLLFIRQFKNPLVLILVGAVVLAAILGEFTNSFIILFILLISGVQGFWQEHKAARAIQALQEMVKVWVRVKRDGKWSSIRFEDVVSGDRIQVSAGDIIPGDCRILNATDLHVNESALTGESFPVEKYAPADQAESSRDHALFQGSSVVSGIAEAVVILTGEDTAFGRIAEEMVTPDDRTAFEHGISDFGALLVQITLILAVGLLIFNVLLGRPVMDSVFFALALAIGLTPELLPTILTTTLAAGARQMARQQVVVKRLSAIQDLGAIDVLCSDKTGTLTIGTVMVHDTPGIDGTPSAKVRQLAYLNAYFESGFVNPLDEALRNMPGMATNGVTKFDEVPYDFIRKRLSVVVQDREKHLMITKGALSHVVDICTFAEKADGSIIPLDEVRDSIMSANNRYSEAGFRVIGVAWKDVTGDPVIDRSDETEMTFAGFILLYDPPKEDALAIFKSLAQAGISLKIITGDSGPTASHLAALIGLPNTKILTGKEMQSVSEEALTARVRNTDLFAEIEPHQKERIIRALQKAGKVVGYLGDGINDVPALKAADVGISVDSGVTVAKETADIILMNKNMEVLLQGITEGRKTYINTLKYIFITTSANFGNMFSLAGISLLIPFLPMLPAQVLLLNFLSDIPALFIASDRVDPDQLSQPKRWNISLIRRFMFVFGAQSSVFDYLTFALLLLVYKVSEPIFQTAWFIESVITEVLILLVIRTVQPVWKSRPGKGLLWAGIAIILITLSISYLPFIQVFGFQPIPVPLLAGLVGIAIIYAFISDYVKGLFFKKYSF